MILEKKILGMRIYEILFCFMIYAFLGWFIEQTAMLIYYGNFEKRGFLFGPYGPIYGYGMLLLALFLTPLKKKLILLYISIVVLTTVFEYLSGALLLAVFNQRWWDYSDNPYNLHGHIDLFISLAWGFGGVLIVKYVHPAIIRLIGKLKYMTGKIVLTVFYSIFTIDSIATFTILIMKRIGKQ